MDEERNAAHQLDVRAAEFSGCWPCLQQQAHISRRCTLALSPLAGTDELIVLGIGELLLEVLRSAQFITQGLS